MRLLSLWMVPVFAYCIWVGKRFGRRCVGHWLVFFFLPVLFSLAAFFALLFLHNTLCWMYYFMSLWIGCIIGLLVTNPVPVKVDTVSQQISAPGSFLLLSCLMVLCFLKCALDYFNVSMPGYSLQLSQIGFSIKGCVTGLLYGQALSFRYRFSIADACPPKELVRGRFAFFKGLKRVKDLSEVSSFVTS